MSRPRAVIVTLLICAALGGGSLLVSGGSSTPKLAATSCPAGKSFMGCALGKPANRALLRETLPSGTRFVDVSSWQGCSINWAAIPVPGAVAKAFEYSQDPCFVHNVASLKAARKFWAPYDFVRSCSAAGFIAAIRSVGGLTSGPAVLDEEVPTARGCTATLADQVHAALGRWPVVYTASGTWPGGGGDGLDLWDATYGPQTDLAGLVGFGKLIAWQFAAPPWVRVNTPGLGDVDTNIDYGLLEMLPAKPTPQLPICFTHRLTRAQCAAVKTEVGHYGQAALESIRAYDARGCTVLYRRQQWFTGRLRTQPSVRTAYRRGALAATTRTYARLSCPVFVGRWKYYDGLLARTEAAN